MIHKLHSSGVLQFGSGGYKNPCDASRSGTFRRDVRWSTRPRVCDKFPPPPPAPTARLPPPGCRRPLEGSEFRWLSL
ncbi:hypothetical protein V5799_023842 [Amblyomma americanum]|uniref:Uncharacterized protein n=1 Tax=Amblyomma americanum TaxID=6943 RepID=A0AAQ4FI16_AMBAM